MDDATARAVFKPRVQTAPHSQDFKNAMARLAGGVGVAACWRDDVPTGLLVSSIAVLSAEPPRVLFCVQKSARWHDALFHARQCSLNILAEDGQAEAERFSSAERAAERFDPALWRLDGRSPPRCASALIGLVGAIGHRMDAGTHTVFVLNVSDVEVREARLLVYFDRRYVGLRPLAGAGL